MGSYESRSSDLREILDRIEGDLKGESALESHSSPSFLCLKLTQSPVAVANKEVYSWLDVKSSAERFEDSLRKKTDGTCEWIFERPVFQQWREADFPAGTKLLWIKGPAGFGKTVLCARIVDELQNSLKTPVANFFISSDHQSREDPYMAVRSWLSQVVSQNTAALDIARQKWLTDPDQTATRATVLDIFSAILQTVPGCTFVVDGLDECTQLDDGTLSVTAFLESILSAAEDTDTRLLIVSRDEPLIRQVLTVEASMNLHEYRITHDDVRPDTATYSRAIVDKKLSTTDNVVRDSLCDAMTDRCQGQFIWLKMQETSLRGRMSKKNLQRTINETPMGLDHLYDRTWTRITSLNTRDRLRVFALLRWAAFALRPLTVHEITEAALIEEDEDTDDWDWDDFPDQIDQEYLDSEITHLCGPLLDVSDEIEHQSVGDRKISLPHFSVRQYLLAHLPIPGFLQQNSILLNVPREKLQNNCLAMSCLKYIKLGRVWHEADSNGNDPDRERLSIALRTYAATFWHQHVRSGTMDDQKLTQLAADFMDASNPTWGAWRDKVDAIDAGENWKPEPKPPAPLYYAVKFRLKGIASAILKRLDQTSQEVNDVSTSGRSALGAACGEVGDFDLVKLLLAHGADVGVASGEYRSALNLATVSGNVDIVKILIENGADIESTTIHGWISTDIAAALGHMDILNLLFEAGANLLGGQSHGATLLHRAAYFGRTKVAKLLIDKGSDLAAANEMMERPIHSAAICGYFDIVKLLIEEGSDIHATNHMNNTPLALAAAKGNTEVVQLLLAHGAETNIMPNDGWTPLRNASLRGSVELVNLLLDNGADIIETDTQQATSVQWASREGHVEVLKILIERGASLNTPSKAGWGSPLGEAAKSGHVEVARLLLSNSVDINAPDDMCRAPLGSASRAGHTEVVRLLIEHGAPLDALDDLHFTPLSLACEQNHIEIVKMLLGKGADDSIPNKFGELPLMVASDRGRTEILSLLLDHRNVNIDAANNQGWTSINSAAANGHYETVKLLVARGADPKKPTVFGCPPLISTSDDGDSRILSLLLETVRDDSIDSDLAGRRGLFWASARGHEATVRVWLESGRCIVDDTDYYGNTPLFAAVRRGNAAITELLLEYGAAVQTLDGFGKDAMWWARLAMNVPIIEILIKHLNGLGLKIPDDFSPEPDIRGAGQTESESYWCDCCLLDIITPSKYVCSFEEHSNLDLCEGCYDAGFGCPTSSHVLERKSD